MDLYFLYGRFLYYCNKQCKQEGGIDRHHISKVKADGTESCIWKYDSKKQWMNDYINVIAEIIILLKAIKGILDSWFQWQIDKPP